jgi:hypothetical protein
MGADFPGCDCSHSNLLAHRMDRAERVTLGEKKISRRTAISHITSTTLADLFRPPLVANPFSTMRAPLRGGAPKGVPR